MLDVSSLCLPSRNSFWSKVHNGRFETKICISSRIVLPCKMKKTKLRNGIKPAKVRLDQCLTYTFDNLREIWTQISLLLILYMLWRFILSFFPPPSDMGEKLTSKIKTPIIIVIIVRHLSLCESKLLFSWLKQKKVFFCLVEKQVRRSNKLKPMCAAVFMDLFSLQSSIWRASSARGSQKWFRRLFCWFLRRFFNCSALVAYQFIRDKILQ